MSRRDRTLRLFAFLGAASGLIVMIALLGFIGVLLSVLLLALGYYVSHH